MQQAAQTASCTQTKSPLAYLTQHHKDVLISELPFASSPLAHIYIYIYIRCVYQAIYREIHMCIYIQGAHASPPTPFEEDGGNRVEL